MIAVVCESGSGNWLAGVLCQLNTSNAFFVRWWTEVVLCQNRDSCFLPMIPTSRSLGGRPFALLTELADEIASKIILYFYLVIYIFLYEVFFLFSTSVELSH